MCESASEIHAGFAAQHIESGLVVGVFMRLGAGAGRDGDDLQMDGLGANRLGLNAWRVGKALLADEGRTGPHDRARDRLLLGFPVLAHDPSSTAPRDPTAISNRLSRRRFNSPMLDKPIFSSIVYRIRF